MANTIPCIEIIKSFIKDYKQSLIEKKPFVFLIPKEKYVSEEYGNIHISWTDPAYAEEAYETPVKYDTPFITIEFKDKDNILIFISYDFICDSVDVKQSRSYTAYGIDFDSMDVELEKLIIEQFVKVKKE